MKGEDFRNLIISRCGNVRRFSKKVGLTESMMCHILHGRRKIFYLDRFAEALNMPEYILQQMMEGESGYDSKTGSRYFRLEG